MATIIKNSISRSAFSAHRLQTDRVALLELAQQFGEESRRNNPYLRLLAVSGSLVRQHEENHEDIDFFAVSSSGHIWDAFLLCLWQGWSFARRHGLPRSFLCFNYLVDEFHLQEIDLTRAEHVRSFLNLVVVLGQETYHTLLVKLRSELESQEPALYKETLKRVESQLLVSGVEGSATRHAQFWPSLFTSMGRLPFIIVVKRAEAIRRGYYPNGMIYSNSRVIRSHLRLAWEKATGAIGCFSTSEAFSEVASDYQEQVVSSSANKHMRSIVHKVLEGIVKPGMRVLDLGAGTGEDAIWLARHGTEVLAIDIAPGMVCEATRRVAEVGLEGRVQVRCLAIENLRDLLPGEAGVFDIILADFGALNLTGPSETWAPVLSRFLKPKGRLVANMVNRWCVWEILAGLATGRVHYALRRLRGEPIRVGSRYLPVTLFTPGAFAKKLNPYFLRLGVLGLCVTALPPDLERFGKKVPQITRFAARLDQCAGRMLFLRNLGDHYLITFERKTGAIVEFHTRARITAAPVVADINHDQVPEIILAADKLYVIGPSGQTLRGFPRRVGGAIASTAACANKGGQTSIFVGSDNDYLNIFNMRGTAISLRHFRTKGDVFSSPWVGDLLEDGSNDIVFGSDDGYVYALDEAGAILPGWPFPTRGYVSASPAGVQARDGKGIVVGSWDGQLYLLDRQGRIFPGWPQQLDFPIWGSAAVADIDGCGYGEIIAAAQKLFVFHGDGRLLAGFPVGLGGYAVASPAVGDINGDGKAEIIVCADGIYAFDKNGKILPGFPFSTGAYIWASPILFDINGDGMPEIVVGDFSGRLWAVQGNGHVSKGFPQKLGSSFSAPATAADIDGDGFMELLVATGDGRFLILSTECTDNRLSAPWPQFRGMANEVPLITERRGRAIIRENKVSQDAGFIKFDGGPPVTRVELSPSTPLPFKLTEVQVTLKDGLSLDGGLLEYELDGKLHPSPLLKSNGHYFGLVQPLQLFKSVNFVLKLSIGDNRYVRYPDEGFLQLRVGTKGIRKKAKETRQ